MRPQASAATAALAALALASSGCLVFQKDLDQCRAEAATYRAGAEAKQKDAAAQILQLQERLTAAESATQDRDARLSDLSTSAHNLQAQLDEATAINQQLRGELQRLGKDVDKILAERGTLSKALEDAKARLEELRKAQAAAEARAMLFRDLAARFKPLADAGQLRIESRRGQLVMELTGDLLFEPGKTEIRTVGKGVLMEVARALETSGGGAQAGTRRFLVTDHVDDEPLKSKRYKNAWELTAARAAAIVDYLVSLKVPAASLTAAGAGSADPRAPNDNADNRAKNRRVEIALLPGPDESLAVH
jgi:chemotaxis protein MotB